MTTAASLPQPLSGEQRRHPLAPAAIACMGVVCGDIGTSPLYTLNVAAKAASPAGAVSPEAVLGVVSLIFWSLIIVISLKYAILIMRADNHGEGGILALLALGLALALSIPETFLWRRPIVATTFAVVAFSIIVQGLTSRPLLRRTCRQDLQLNDPA